MSDTETAWPWSVLGLKDTCSDPKDVRRAYAKKLKSIDPSADIDGFQALRYAYSRALKITQNNQDTQDSRSVSQGLPEIRTPTNDNTYFPPQPAPTPTSDGSKTVELDQEIDSSDYSIPENLFKRFNELTSYKKTLTLEEWSPLLSSVALTDPVVAQRVEWMLQENLAKNIGYYRSSINAAKLCNAIDERFGWVSDGIGFLKRYPHRRNLQATVSTIVRQNAWRFEERQKQIFTPKETKIKPVPAIYWAAAIILYFLLLVI